MFADHKTSLRGGFAITHDPIFAADYNPDYTAVPPWPGYDRHQHGLLSRRSRAMSAFTPSAAPGWDYYINKAPYLIQYNLNIQRELGQSTVLTVGYVGSHGVDMLTEQERNPSPPTIVNGVYYWGTSECGRHRDCAGSAPECALRRFGGDRRGFDFPL